MSKSTISTFKLFEPFPDEESAYAYEHLTKGSIWFDAEGATRA